MTHFYSKDLLDKCFLEGLAQDYAYRYLGTQLPQAAPGTVHYYSTPFMPLFTKHWVANIDNLIRRNSMKLDCGVTPLRHCFDVAAVNKYPKEFNIQKVDNGFVVTVGCKTLVFGSQRELFNAMKLYLADPAKAEKKYAGGKA